MFSKSKALILCFMLCIGLLVPLESNAQGYTASSPHNEPTVNEQAGYLNILVEHPTAGRILYTIQWNFNPVKQDSEFDRIANCQMDIVVNQKSVVLRGINTASDAYLTIFENTAAGVSQNIFSGKISNSVDKTLSYGGPIIACSVFGNYGTFSTYFGVYTPQVSVIWNTENNIINQLVSVYNQLVISNQNDLEMIEKLNSIMQSNASIDSKFSQLLELQEETNTWLKKIFDWLNETKEEERQEVQTQGSSSVSQGNDAIQNSGEDFEGSIIGLVNSMNYSGTDCKWTFPEVKMPAISGVMDETILIKKQDIDFGMWIDKIPANIMLLIRSLLTGALIVYCFKELYGTISYVLTLKGSGINE